LTEATFEEKRHESVLDIVRGYDPQRDGGLGRITAEKPAVRATKATGVKSGEGKCAPQATLSDTDFANKILASQQNQEYVRQATLAKERNNQKGYQAAIDKISCPKTSSL
jgi:hypothetical protein